MSGKRLQYVKTKALRRHTQYLPIINYQGVLVLFLDQKMIFWLFDYEDSLIFNFKEFVVVEERALLNKHDLYFE